MKYLKKYHKIFLFIVLMLPLFSWMQPGMPILHDGQDHVARIANFYQNLSEGILIPRWAGNLNWGYGHPILMFLYPLPSYVASLFHVMGFSLVTSTKLVFVVSYIFAGMCMYLWMREEFGIRAAVIGALLYSFAPYRFVDLHVRGAIGEHVAFIFPPLILLTLYKKKWILFSFCVAGLILSHNAIALMFLSIILAYCMYLFFHENKKRMYFLGNFAFYLCLGFSLASFFWVPALLEGKFTLRDIVTAGEAMQRFVSWSWFLYSPWNYGGTDQLTKFFGFGQWIGVICSIILYWKTREKKLRNMLIGLLILLLLSSFLMTSASEFIWSNTKILQNFQFPWRFLSISVFICAALGGIAVPRMFRNTFFLIGYCLFIVITTCWMWWPKGFALHDDSFYSGVYFSTTDTGESSPIWSVRFMEHTPANPLSVVDGSATITPIKRTSTEHEYEIDVAAPTTLLENTLYFPGWKIYVNDTPTGIQFQNPDYRGLMLFRVTEESKRIRVTFEDTKIRKTSNIVSGITLVLMFMIFLWQTKKRYQ